MVTYLKYYLVFEWCVIRHGSKNGYQKTWLKEIGRRVQNMITIMGLLVDMIERGEGGEGLIWPFIEHKHIIFDNKYDISINSKNHEGSGYSLGSYLLTISY